MKTIMRLSSSSGKKFIDVVKNDGNYVLLDQRGSVIAKRSENDENGVNSLMDFVNNLTDNYSWSETQL